MAVKIGSRYKENLARVKNYLLSIMNGGWQEEPEVLEVDGSGRCYYDNFPAKEEKADRVIFVSYDSGKRIEGCFFHSACIEDLLSDNDIPYLN